MRTTHCYMLSYLLLYRDVNKTGPVPTLTAWLFMYDRRTVHDLVPLPPSDGNHCFSDASVIAGSRCSEDNSSSWLKGLAC